MLRCIIGSLALITVVAAVCYGQPSERKNPVSVRETAPEEEESDYVYPWAGTVFLAGGWGTPQGTRIELGANAGEHFFMGACFGIGDNWSRDPAEGTVGLFAGIHFTGAQPSYLSVYLMGVVGGTIAIFGGGDRYRLINIGAMISVTPLITLRPEFTVAFTSRYIRGGNGLFGGSSPLVHEPWNTHIGANLIMELELRQLF